MSGSERRVTSDESQTVSTIFYRMEDWEFPDDVEAHDENEEGRECFTIK